MTPQNLSLCLCDEQLGCVLVSKIALSALDAWWILNEAVQAGGPFPVFVICLLFDFAYMVGSQSLAIKKKKEQFPDPRS